MFRVEESMAGQVGINGLLKAREGKYKRRQVGVQVVAGSRESMLLFSMWF
jgi:hypothetical protein